MKNLQTTREASAKLLRKNRQIGGWGVSRRLDSDSSSKTRSSKPQKEGAGSEESVFSIARSKNETLEAQSTDKQADTCQRQRRLLIEKLSVSL